MDGEIESREPGNSHHPPGPLSRSGVEDVRNSPRMGNWALMRGWSSARHSLVRPTERMPFIPRRPLPG